MYDISTKYRYSQNGKIRDLLLYDTDGHHIRAQLALKTDNVPRPLVIIKCGIYCNLGSAALRKAIMHLFDEAPFHVLVLPGVTGSDFEADNAVMTLGGLDEGRQILHVARYLQSPYFFAHKKVSSVHVLGESLGGHAALYSALYNDSNPRADGSKWIKSFFVGCPVVDLKKSLTSLFQPNIIGKLISSSFRNQIRDLYDLIPGLKPILSPTNPFNSIEDIPNLILKIVMPYYSETTQNPQWWAAPFKGHTITSEDDYWNLNKFQTYAKDVSSPVFVWAARNDSVVRAKENTELLLQQASNNQLGSNMNVLVTDHGGHCSPEANTSWTFVGAMMRNYFMLHSPEFTARQEQKQIELKVDQLKRARFLIGEFETRSSVWFEAILGQKKVLLKSEIRGRECLESLSKGAFMNCRRFSVVSLGFEELGLQNDDLPSNEEEVSALNRLLNARYSLVDSNGVRVEAHTDPHFIRWSSYRQ